MDEKELLNFIEKLVSILPNDRIWLDEYIKKLDTTKLKYSDIIRDKLFELKLLKETNDTFDELTPKGFGLKKFKTFKKLNKSNEPPFFTKYKNELWFLLTFIGLILISIPIYKSCDTNDSKVDKNVQSQNPKNLNIEQIDKDTINMKSKLSDTLQAKN